MLALMLIITLVSCQFNKKEKSTKTKVIGIGLGAIGSISLTLLSKSTSSDASSLGDLFILFNAISYSIYLVLVKPLMVKYSPLTVISWVFTFGLIYVLIWPFSTSEFLGRFI